MAVKQLKEGGIVVSGFEKGIAASPHVGAADMRNVNLTSSMGQASVNFKTSALTIPPTVTSLAFTVAATGDLFTVASTSGWYNGMAFTLNTLSGGTGLVTARTYWVGNLSGNTFKAYKNPGVGGGVVTPVDVTLDGSGTLSSYTLGQAGFNPQAWTIDYSRQFPYLFFVDGSGQVWWVNNFVTGPGTLSSVISFMGNTTTTFGFGQGICAYAGYLFVFRAIAIDYLSTNTIAAGTDVWAAWNYAWQTASGGVKDAMVSIDNKMYWCDTGSNIGSLATLPGSTFDPATAATYAYTQTALDLPNNDTPTALCDLGPNLIIGSSKGFLYPWDRVSPSFDIPVTLPENNVHKIVAANSLAYVFCGNRGYIYATNGSSIVEYKKIPDTVTGEFVPYFTWGNALIWRNQLYFSFTATKNDGTALTTTGGVWAVDLSSEVLRGANQLSYGSYGGACYMIAPNVMVSAPAGNGIYAGWTLSNVPGIDESSALPYSNYEARIDTEIIPIGTFIEKYTPSHFEFKLSRPLVTGEAIRLSIRPDLTSAYTVIGTTTTSTLISDSFITPGQEFQWAQFRIEMSSTASSPSYVPVTELRMSNTN